MTLLEVNQHLQRLYNYRASMTMQHRSREGGRLLLQSIEALEATIPALEAQEVNQLIKYAPDNI